MRRPDQGFALLPQEGALVNWSSYWERALGEGDIVLIDQEEALSKSAPNKRDNAGSGS